MKIKSILFVLAVTLCAAGVRAQDSNQTPAAPAAAPEAAPQTAAPEAAAPTKKETKAAKRKAAWENGVKKDCSAEIAEGGVCAGKDFGSDLMKCLQTNRKTLSDGCKAVLHHRRGAKAKKAAAAPSGAEQPAPAATPAQQ